MSLVPASSCHRARAWGSPALLSVNAGVSYLEKKKKKAWNELSRETGLEEEGGRARQGCYSLIQLGQNLKPPTRKLERKESRRDLSRWSVAMKTTGVPTLDLYFTCEPGPIKGGFPPVYNNPGIFTSQTLRPIAAGTFLLGQRESVVTKQEAPPSPRGSWVKAGTGSHHCFP